MKYQTKDVIENFKMVLKSSIFANQFVLKNFNLLTEN